jgi:1-acyl-sn-glycerol-3-phosphate acyltransferase
MIFKQILFLISYLYFGISYSYLFLTPSLLISKKLANKNNKKSIKLSQVINTIGLIDGFKADFHIAASKTNIKEIINDNPDKIDVLISNHLSTLDHFLLKIYLEYIGIESFNYSFAKNNFYYIPGIGLVCYSGTDIKFCRNWEEDKNLLAEQIDKIETGTKKQLITIFPEGSRLTPKKLEDGQKFSRLNNLPVYNNLLVPKSKGLWFIVNHLNQTNRLGRVWDLTLAVPKFMKKSSYLDDILGKSIGPVYGMIKELKIDFDTQNSELFKIWLLEKWKNKDEFLKNYKKFIYKKLEIKPNKKHMFSVILICLIFSLLLGFKYGRIYLIISLIVSYIIIILNK